MDLCDKEGLEKIVTEIKPEFIFHLARYHSHKENLTDTVYTNIIGTFNLLQATAPLDYRCFVHTGSFLEYGKKLHPIKESDLLLPSTSFGAAKASATLLCQQFAHNNQRPFVILRLFSVYGYWEGSTRLIPTAIQAVLHSRKMELTIPGYRRDLIFIEDVVRAYILAIQVKNLCGEIINIGTGQEWTNEEVVNIIQSTSGRHIEVHPGKFPARPSDTIHSIADNRKAKQLLGWEPNHTLRAGLEKTIKWFQLQKEGYTKTKICKVLS